MRSPSKARHRSGVASPLGLPRRDDDDQAAKYDVADDVLRAAGLEWYEVSNWARPGHECRHNLLTWGGGDYLAIGCAAHGHRGGRRWWNVRTPERYVERITAGLDPEGGHEQLDDTQRVEEAITLALAHESGRRARRARRCAPPRISPTPAS